MSTFSKFNLNHKVMVRLRDKGYQHLADQHNQLAEHFPNMERHDAEHYRKMADADGYTTMQGWCFMQDFGPVTNLGAHGYFDLDILIEQPGLRVGAIDRGEQ